MKILKNKQLNTKSYLAFNIKSKNKQSLSLLLIYGISYPLINECNKLNKDVRKVSVGNSYSRLVNFFIFIF